MDYEISEYCVLEGTVDELQSLVGDQLGEGWVPLGGVAPAHRLADGEQRSVFAQAMIRVGGRAKSPAVTVPIVSVHEEAPVLPGPVVLLPDEVPAGADDLLDPDLAGPVVTCPLCHAPIPASSLRDGLNTCAKCHREIMVEWGG